MNTLSRATSAATDPFAARYILVLLQTNGSIDRSLAAKIRRDLEDTVKQPRDDVEIDVWLESPGGDAHAAFKIGGLLRHFAHRIRVVVPDYAKSAATLLTLCADEIYMGPGAELGPLDAQIPNEGEVVDVISALDIAQSVDELAQAAMTIAVSGGAQIVATTGLSRSETISAMLEFAAAFMEPIVQQLDPTMMHWSSSLLKVAPEYGRRLLHDREVGSGGQEIAQRLVDDYPTHGFVITEKEAQSLGLPVRPMGEYDLANEARDLHRAFELSGRAAVHVIAVGDIVPDEAQGDLDATAGGNGASDAEHDGDRDHGEGDGEGGLRDDELTEGASLGVDAPPDDLATRN